MNFFIYVYSPNLDTIVIVAIHQMHKLIHQMHKLITIMQTNVGLMSPGSDLTSVMNEKNYKSYFLSNLRWWTIRQ